MKDWEFNVGDDVTPIGWMLNTPKPTGRVEDRTYTSAGQRVLVVKWSDGRTSRVSPSVVELTS